MNIILNRMFVSVAVLLMIGIVYSCKKEDSSPTAPNFVPTAPPFADPIPFAAIGSGKLSFQRIGPSGYNYNEVYVVDGTQRQVRGLGYTFASWPVLSPDGTKIACVHSSMDYQTLSNIAVANADGTGLTVVTNFIGQENFPTWNYDGSMVLYWSTKDSPIMNLFWQTPVSNPSNLKNILTQSLGFVLGRTSISSTDILLYLDSGWKTMAIHACDVSTSSDVVLRSDSSMLPGRRMVLSAPTWSPDGLTIAFLEELSDSIITGQFISVSVTVKVMDKGGKNVRTVTIAPASGDAQWGGAVSQSLAWSPDGTKIAFTKPDGHLEAHIYVVNLDGSGYTAVTFTTGVTDIGVSWSL